ncbi:MAG: exported protein of unknown function [Nitrosopumilales archaeon]|nr:MAG: exported protein of unknown function [Nitrosopumilales archaeon]
MKNKSRFASLLLLMPLFVVATTLGYNNLAFAQANSFIEIQYSINVGEDRYFIHYNVCAGEKSIVSPSIILESEQDTVQVDSTKIIGENSCQGFESFIDTKSPSLVKITVVE